MSHVVFKPDPPMRKWWNPINSWNKYARQESKKNTSGKAFQKFMNKLTKRNVVPIKKRTVRGNSFIPKITNNLYNKQSNMWRQQRDEMTKYDIIRDRELALLNPVIKK